MGRKPRSRLKSRLYVAWLMLVCVGIVSAMAWMAPQEPATTGGGGGTAAVHSNGWFVGGVLLGEPLLGEKFNGRKPPFASTWSSPSAVWGMR